MSGIIEAGIVGGASLLGSGINAYGQGRLNRKNRDFQREMYQRTRQDNLADWHMQNQYNSPEEQMRRLKQAGLNPNLVYGQGAVANSTSLPKQGEVPNANMAPVQVDLSGIGDAINTYYNVQQAQQDIKFKQQQTDNLKKQNELMEQDKLLRQYQAIESFIRGERGKFELDFRKETQGYSKEFMQLTNKLKAIDYEKTAQQVSQSATMFPTLLKMKKQAILNMKNQIDVSQTMLPYQTGQLASSTKLNMAKILLVKAQTETEPERRFQLTQQAFKLIREGQKMDYDQDLRENYGIEKGDSWMNQFLRGVGNLDRRERNTNKGFSGNPYQLTP